MPTTSINFPSASNISKLSACPTTKIPEGTDWIYQDFFNSMLNSNNEYCIPPSIQLSELYPTTKNFNEALTQVVSEQQKYNITWDNYIDYRFCPTSMTTTSSGYDQMSLPDLDNTKSSDEEEDSESIINSPSDFSLFMDVAPVLIESTITSCTTSSEGAMSFRYNHTMETTATQTTKGLNKRKSTSSFHSLRSFINVFSNNKKSKLTHTTTTTTTVKKDPSTGTLTKKLLNYFNRRRSSS